MKMTFLLSNCMLLFLSGCLFETKQGTFNKAYSPGKM